MCFECWTINIQILRVLPAAVSLFSVTVSVQRQFTILLLFLVFLYLTLFPNSFSPTPPLSVPPLSLSLSRYSMSLPSSFSVSTPPSSPLFSLLPSWQQCQSGQADRGIHSTGQSRGRSKGWRIDYVYVCVLNCPVCLCLRVCLRFGHTQAQVLRVVSLCWCFTLFVVDSVFDTVACVCYRAMCEQTSLSP